MDKIQRIAQGDPQAPDRFPGIPGVAHTLSVAGQSLLRVALLFGVGLPYVMAAVMTYRPRVVPRDDPMMQLGLPYESVRFHATDGTRLFGWWIPALPTPRAARICSQNGSGLRGLLLKSNQLIIARELVKSGYNVPIFDFRAW
jgi:hypothetical protein